MNEDNLPITVAIKLVKCFPDEGWGGDYIKNGVHYFSVDVYEETECIWEHKNRKKKKVLARKPTGKYRISCRGNDDLYICKRGLSFEEAMELYNLIFDGVSRKELKALGIDYE